ncbi:peptidase S16 [Hwanghaeella grinnelliae]|uniref:Peptidase S16 n=1 Tax=Hwanghaeella grinnelliae TaxID=2500179 RepID=A0A3S2Z739_9PROT|nr:LON peptidase substrate-binding domain-containing protein [Hwanghaeella grinnelliae]RVU36157.1 peptidase S16 [Hwanghaeella grinnelliae]
MSVFDPTAEDLPEDLPIFPLTGVLLLPRAQLPLNVFEPRYLNMITDALGEGRMIGMIQPRVPRDFVQGREDDEDEEDDLEITDMDREQPAIFPVGCAGRITQFEETDDGRLLINLRGIARFKVTEEMPMRDGYRRVQADWSDYLGDLTEHDEATPLDKERLFASLKPYFEAQEIQANWDAVHDTPSERLINSLSMICPFEALEKQALLEAPTLKDRLDVLTSLVEMAVLETTHEESGRQ